MQLPGFIEAADAMRVRRLVARAGLPVTAPDFGTARYFDLMRSDKKADAGSIRYVLLKRMGEAFVAAVPDEQVIPALSASFTVAAQTC